MKVQKIKESPITSEDINSYKEAISKLEGFMFTASDVNMDKRIITVRLGNIEDELTLVNPTVIKTSEQPLVYFEKDTNKENKVREYEETYLNGKENGSYVSYFDNKKIYEKGII